MCRCTNITLHYITLDYIRLHYMYTCVVYQSLAGGSASAQSSGAICRKEGRKGVMSFPHWWVDLKDGFPPFNNIQQPIDDR